MLFRSLVIDSLNLVKVSVGPAYFNSVVLPLTMPLAVLVGFASAVGWKRTRAAEVAKRLRVPALIAVLGACALPWLLGHRTQLAAIGGGVLAIWVLASSLQEIVRRVRAKRDRLAGLTQIPREIGRAHV